MPRIDAHQHFWEYQQPDYAWISDEMAVLQADFLPAALQAQLEAAQFEGCVAVQARQSEVENDFLLQLAQANNFIRGVVGWADLQSPEAGRQLQALSAHSKLKGIRHIVQDEPDERFLLRPAFLEGIGLLKDYGLTYDILVFESHFPVVLQFLERFPDQPFVLDHLGKPVIEGGPSADWVNGIRAIASHPNVFCKLSGLVTEAPNGQWEAETFFPFLEVAVEAFGAERLMVGSDWPVCLLAAGSYDTVISIIDQFAQRLTGPERAAIYGDTATQFYML